MQNFVFNLKCNLTMKLSSLISNFLKDPGVLLALANAFLFLGNGFSAFLTIIVALILILTLQIYSQMSGSNNLRSKNPLKILGRKKFLGLEIMGYACLIVAFIAMTQQDFTCFVCSFCFGLANLLLALKLSPHLQPQAENWNNAIKNAKSTYSLTPLLLAILNEPLLLICIGFVHAGLAAGNESLWILPLICIIPYIIIKNPHANRAFPQGCFCISALWYTFVAMNHHQWNLVISNALCAIAYVEIAIQEHKLFLTRLRQMR